MITRKLGKLLRGSISPYQIYTATILGGLAGASLGWGQAPGWNLLLFLSLLILNANLFLAAISWAVSSLLVLLLMPVLFRTGTFLVEGPLNGLVAMVVNAPVGAWFGWEYYVTLPSLVIGGIFGFGLGMALTRFIRQFRTKMASLETGSDRFQKYTGKGWVRILAWILFGGLKGKKSWEELAASQKRGMPVRGIGIVFASVTVVFVFVALRFLDSSILTALLRDQLEQVNGATVNVESVELNAADQALIIQGLQVADPSNLDRNRFAAGRVEANLSGIALLAKKIEIDRVEITDAQTDSPRTLRAYLVGPEPKEMKAESEKEEDEFSLNDYLEKGSAWQQRLQTFQRFYEKIAGQGDSEKKPEEEAEEKISFRERLEARAEAEGYRRVASGTVIRNSPRLLIRELQALGIEVGLDDSLMDLRASQLASEPYLVDSQRGEIQLKRQDGTMSLQLQLPWAEAPDHLGFSVEVRELPVEEIKKSTGDKLPLDGGMLDIVGTGSVQGGSMDLPLQVVVKDSTLQAFNQTVEVKELPLEVAVSGPLTQPKIKIPQDALKDALLQGGKQKVMDLIEEKGGGQIKDLLKGFGGGGG